MFYLIANISLISNLTGYYFVSEEGGAAAYTIVISQHEKSTTLRFSVKVFGTISFKFAPVPNPYRGAKELRVESEWSVSTAGGSTNNLVSHDRNPRWTLSVAASAAGGGFESSVAAFRAAAVFGWNISCPC